MLDLIRSIRRCEQGATAVEYGLIAALVSVAITIAVSNVASSTSEMWNYVSDEIISSV